VAVGDLIVVRAGTGRNGRPGGRAAIARRLGRSDVARDVIEALMVDRGLRRRFDPAVEHEARDLAAGLGDSMRVGEGRRDLRSLAGCDGRLDYDRVDRIFADREEAAGAWGPGLAAARAAAAALATRRDAQGALEIDSAEPEFEFDERGDVVSVEPVAQTESHRMIEHLMIAANEQVARHLTARRVPTLYRVHERPDGTAAQRLIDQLASVGVP